MMPENFSLPTSNFECVLSHRSSVRNYQQYLGAYRDTQGLRQQLPETQCSTYINSYPAGQNGRHFTDDISRCIFVNETFCILIKVSLKFVHKGQTNNCIASVQIMAWRRIGAKPVTKSMLTRFTDAYTYMWYKEEMSWWYSISHIRVVDLDRIFLTELKLLRLQG